jgi:hypothetical protein
LNELARAFHSVDDDAARVFSIRVDERSERCVETIRAAHGGDRDARVDTAGARSILK